MKETRVRLNFDDQQWAKRTYLNPQNKCRIQGWDGSEAHTPNDPAEKLQASNPHKMVESA